MTSLREIPVGMRVLGASPAGSVPMIALVD